MKTTITVLLIAMATSAFAQIPGTQIDGPITIFDTLKVNLGDTLYLGRGSDPRSGDFVFIYQPANGWLGVPEQKMRNFMTGTHVNVKMFKELNSKRYGRKVFTIINHGGLNSIVELEAAIRAGEIVAINSLNVEPKKEPQVVVVKESSVSVADELKKLKQLLNDSTITQEEYDKMKAKLLGQ